MAMDEEMKKIRCGDIVRATMGNHDGSAVVETLVVAYADYETGYLVWSGWPPGEVEIAKCELVKACTDEDHLKEVAQWLDGQAFVARLSDRRQYMVQRLYRPEAHRLYEIGWRQERIATLEKELADLKAGVKRLEDEPTCR